ncbi:hypothetical protein SAMN05216503_1829 [Polaribacter sp. KT25b]|uniref:hypothetical protein n=1 Tax=Polaribacter sp. KT25b TaxID=1855336 RepID=UPI00087966CD|nr:hypothetical protein [Polaribacter sp. KT25b]SDS05365.1 hypothetical protein SAMN05216503_1829 [Polaribacter sp. KT25b]
MNYSFLLDNNIYREIVKYGNEIVFENFNSDIKNHRIIKNIPVENIIYSLTPFTIMEALGITIPYPKIILPLELKSPKKYNEAFIFINDEAKKYFSNLSLIKPKELLKKVKQQKKFTSLKAKKTEQIFIENPLKTKEFYDYFLESLVFDYTCKYEFPREVQKRIFSEYLLPTFFLNNHTISRFSKFRIIKRLWDNSYTGLKKSPVFPKGYFEEINNSMKLKGNQDFLDCEIIHFACVGDCVESKHNPVFVFTQDDKKTIINRIIVYKSMIKTILNDLSEDNYKINKPIINNWEQGMIIFCNSDGSIKESIDVSDIKTIN